MKKSFKKLVSSPGTKGQRDKLKILPWEGMDQDNLSRSGTWDGTITIFSCYRTSFSCFRTSFPCFLVSFVNVILSPDVPGQKSLSWDICFYPCPGKAGQRDKEILLYRDKATL